MEVVDQLDELLSCRLDAGRKAVKPCTMMIFGASGDLTARKLIPALYHLYREKQLPDPFRIVGFARRAKSAMPPGGRTAPGVAKEPAGQGLQLGELECLCGQHVLF